MQKTLKALCSKQEVGCGDSAKPANELSKEAAKIWDELMPALAGHIQAGFIILDLDKELIKDYCESVALKNAYRSLFAPESILESAKAAKLERAFRAALADVRRLERLLLITPKSRKGLRIENPDARQRPRRA